MRTNLIGIVVRKLTAIAPELFTAGILVACWSFAAARLQLISLACIGLLLFRRLEDIRTSGAYQTIIRGLRRSQSELVHIALKDRLTELLNRHALLSNLDNLLNSNTSIDHKLTVLFLDFDRFKVVNDSLGHEVGDQLLVQIGHRLRDFVNMQDRAGNRPAGNLAGRLGGDEFVLVIRCCVEEEVQRIVRSLMAVLEEPYYVGETKICSTASIGIVINSGQYTEAHAMIRDADVAMYESKRRGRSQFLMFDTPMRDRVQRRQRLEVDIGRAMERCELQLVYQPIICVRSGELKFVEALMRWRHPRDGWVAPVEFIPIAEECGAIQKLFEWAVCEGCNQLRKWNDDARIAPTYSFSLNLSPHQFADPALADRIARTIGSTGIEPSKIVFELTESVLMSEPASALRILQTIKSYGSRITLDDFGTGYSSLASLHRFPVDILKFDRSFIKDIQKDRNLASMVYSITGLARNMGIATIAEGIETPQQLVVVRELGCDLAQGYFIAKPLSAAEFSEFARDRGPKVPYYTGVDVFDNPWKNAISPMSFPAINPMSFPNAETKP